MGDILDRNPSSNWHYLPCLLILFTIGWEGRWGLISTRANNPLTTVLETQRGFRAQCRQECYYPSYCEHSSNNGESIFALLEYLNHCSESLAPNIDCCNVCITGQMSMVIPITARANKPKQPLLKSHYRKDCLMGANINKIVMSSLFTHRHALPSQNTVQWR